MHPSVWTDYRRGVTRALDRVAAEGGLRRLWEADCEGCTGIEGFDAWVQELAGTGYLHNHARMWFASIWIFTQRLPWELRADFFLRHLLDGDPASNTLFWRWVGACRPSARPFSPAPTTLRPSPAGAIGPLALWQAPPAPSARTVGAPRAASHGRTAPPRHRPGPALDRG
jgi:deoxyribodipyrimidine photo-lyase